MSGISSTLSIAKTAISTQQHGLNITGQNIANVNNPNYSVQSADQTSRKPAAYGGFLFGTGVDMFQIQQSVDALLEARLTGEQSTQASLEEQESYMRVLEGFFDESSETSLTTVLTEFWNSWHDLSDNPQGSSERVAIYESGNKLTNRFESTVLDMDKLLTDISSDISAAVQQINTLSVKIADLNREILSAEIYRTANDQRDQRTALIKELGDLIDISTFEQGDGALIVNAANGFTLVNGVDSYSLSMTGKDVVWQGSTGSGQVITDKITSGKIGGLLEIRDSVIPKYQAQVNELSREMIWAINYQHSQGAGLTYYNEPVVGDYQADESGWLTSFEFGDKIDFSKAFTMWLEDKTGASTEYSRIHMDMGESEARITNWQGAATGGNQSIYKLTVMDSATLGDMEVMETDGSGLASVQTNGSTSGVATSLDGAIAGQTLTVYNGPTGTSVIEIKDVGGDAKRSAASIAQALSQVDGVSAYASATSATYQLIDNGGIQDGDEVKFSLYVDGVVQAQSFIRDSVSATLQEQYENALLAGVEAMNLINEDDDLYLDGLTLNSSAGRTLGIQDFEVQDNTGIRLDNFANFDSGDTVTFVVDSSISGSGTAAASTTSVDIDLSGVDVNDAGEMAKAFSEAMAAELDTSLFSVVHDPYTNSVVLRTLDGSGIRLRNGSGDTGDDALVNVSALGGSNTTSGAADTELRFNNVVDASDTVRYDAIALAVDNMSFSGQGTGTLIAESTAGAGNKNAVITGTVSVVAKEGIVLQSTAAGAGGLFSTNTATRGSSILTFGGEGGFSGFSTAGGETISFDLDGHQSLFDTTAGAGTSDLELAQLFETEIISDLAAAGVAADYTVVRTASSISVIKNIDKEEPIKVENFSDTLGASATFRVLTGTGKGTNSPENDLLDADPSKTYRNFTTSSLYDDEGVIRWERLDADGVRTGATGLIHVEDEGEVTIMEGGKETLTFDIAAGSLVAGNTLTINTDAQGRPDPLDFRITGRANSINELYQFKVVSGGKVGHLPGEGEEPLVIEWSNSVTTGTFTIEGNDPPYTPLAPVEVQVDGMNFKIYDGTLFAGDVFTVTTGSTGIPLSQTPEGNPTGETLSDWH
ncbi:MAG: flagellar hook-associated protein FlgK [Desulfobacter sp.]|nr:flagellar hook-associated protein FlgK [Desulfobacter sp.]